MGREHFDKMKSGCIVCNMGHSNTEIDLVNVLRVAVSVLEHVWVFTVDFFSFFSGISADDRAEVAESEASRRPHRLARWQASYSAG